MTVTTGIRYVILVVCGGAMLAGIAIMAGWLVPRQFPGDYNVIFGAVIFLYGAYRFAIVFMQMQRENRDGL